MKKTYHQPATFVVRLATSSIVATSSFNEALGTTNTDGGDALVKEQQPASYNVWSEDWSK